MFYESALSKFRSKVPRLKLTRISPVMPPNSNPPKKAQKKYEEKKKIKIETKEEQVQETVHEKVQEKAQGKAQEIFQKNLRIKKRSNTIIENGKNSKLMT